MSLDILGEIIKSYEYTSVTVEQIESLSIMLQHKAFEPLYPLIVEKIKEFDEKEKEIQKKISAKCMNHQTQPKTKPVDNIQLTFTLTGFDIQPSSDSEPEPYDQYDPYEESWSTQETSYEPYTD